MSKSRQIKRCKKRIIKYQNEERYLLKLLHGYQNEVMLLEHKIAIHNNEKIKSN